MMRSLDDIRRGFGVNVIPNTSLSTFSGSAPIQPTRRTATPPRQPAQRPIQGVQGSDLQDRIAAFRAGRPAAAPEAPEEEDLPWYKDVLGAALGNPVAKTAMQPLEWLTTGGRAAVAGVENLARALPEEAEFLADQVLTRNGSPNGGILRSIDEDREVELEDGSTTSDIGSWWDRAKDPEYGFGTASRDTGNVWADRVTGFAGDVVLDPLTYVTLGSGAAVGKTGRLNTAVKAAAAGADDATVKAISTRGPAILSDAERALYGVERSGVRFAGARIPGSGGVARGAGRATSRVRSSVTNSRWWQYITEAPDGMLKIDLDEAYKVLNTNKYTGSMTARGAAAVIDMDSQLRRFKKATSQPAVDVAARLFDGKAQNELDQLSKAVEAGDFTALQDVNRYLLDEARKAGVEIGDLGTNFIHHMWTDEGNKLLGFADVKKNGKTIKLAPSGTTQSRLFQGGKYTIDGVDVDFGRGTIDEINKELKRAFGVNKALETDARQLTNRYIDMVTNDIAVVSAFNEVIRKHPDVFNWLDVVGDEVLDKVATKTANKELKRVLRQEGKLRKAEFAKEVTRAQGHAAELQATLVNQFTADAAEAGGFAGKSAKLLNDLKEKGSSLDAAGKQLAKEHSTVRKAAEKRVAELEGQLAKVEDQIAAAQVALAGADSSTSRLAAYNEFVQTKTRLTQEIADGRGAVAEIERASEDFAELLDTLKALEFNAKDPDFVEEMVQDFARTREVQVRKLVEGGEENLNQSQVLLDEVDRKIAVLQEKIANPDVAGEAARRADIQDGVESAIESAMRAEGEALEGVKKVTKAVNRSRANRDGAAAPVSQVVAPERRINGPKTALDEGQGLDTRSSAELSKILSDLDDTMRAADAQKPLAAEQARLLKESLAEMDEGVAARAVANEQAANAERAAKRYGARADAATEALATTRREQPGWSAYKQEVQMAEAAKWTKMHWIAKSELTKARLAARRAAQKSGKSVRSADVEKLNALEMQVEQLRRQADEVVGALPEAEQKLMNAYNKAAEKRAARTNLEGIARNIEQRWARADRLGTNEAQLSALQETRRLLGNHAEANRSYKAGVFDTVTETVPAETIPARADVVAAQNALPDTTPMVLTKAQAKPIQKSYFRATLKPSDMKKGVAFKDPEVFRAAPAEVRTRWNEIKRQIRPNGNRRVRTEQAPLLEEATKLAEFAHRYKAGLDSGLEGGDQLAARVTREMQASEMATLKARASRLRTALSSGTSSKKKMAEFERAYRQNFENAADELDAAEKRLAGLRNRLRKLGGADADSKFRGKERPNAARQFGDGREVDDVRDATGAAAERAELTFLIRQAKEDRDNLRMLMSDMIETVARPADNTATSVRGGRVRGGYAHSPAVGKVAKGHIIPREGDRLGRAIQLDTAAAAKEKSAYLKDMTDTVRGVVRRGQDPKDAMRKQDALFDRLWAQAQENPRTMGKLQTQLEEELGDTVRAQRLADRRWNSMGKGAGDVREDWRGVLMEGRGEALEPQRARLDQFGEAYARTDENMSALQDTLRQDMRDNVGQRQAQLPAANRLPAAEAELAGMPANFNDAANAARNAAQDDLAQVNQGASTLASQLDEADAALRAVDEKAADEFRDLDALRKINDNMLGAATQQSKVAGERVEQLKKLAAKADKYSTSKPEVEKTFEQLDAIVAQLDDSPEMAEIFAAHAALAEQMINVERAGMTAKQAKMFEKRAREGKLTEVFAHEAKRGWHAMTETVGKVNQSAVADGVLDPTGGGQRQFAYADDVSAAFRNLEAAANDPANIGRMFDTMTQLFKTYATATPGFHVRNAMSATFMNLVAGVGVGAQQDAFKAYRAYAKAADAGDIQWIRRLADDDPQMADAFAAIFGSGAGGNYGMAELGSHSGQRIFDNKWTTFNKKVGEKVEGTVRLGMALDTVRKGGSVQDAMARVESFHFDYSKLSKLDRQVKRAIPFWTFMSRNLPLQMQMMYQRPGMYLAFEKMSSNFGMDIENMPQWMAEQSAMALTGDEDGYHAFMPDLAHLDMTGRNAVFNPLNAERALSQTNPLFSKTLEGLANRQYYFSNEVTDKDGWAGAGERALHTLSGIVSPIAQGRRVLATDGKYKDRQRESVLNFLGIPYREITPERMEGEYQRRYYEERGG